jgi:4-hydroxy-tetrahydrodipicolinate reductase
MSIRLLINGARGRMGAQISRMAGEDSRFYVMAQRDAGDADPPRDAAIDVVIDFSSDAGARDALRFALAHGAALLVGSTGLTDQTRRALDDAAGRIALLVAPNTSLGVAVLAHLAGEAARLLGPAFDIDIIETHHTRKTDAPSGTALRLAAALRQRGGEAGARFADQRIHAIRSGDVVGEHEVRFAGPGERLTLIHSATSRELFVRGALHAAAFLARKPAGRYTIEQALGIETSKRINVQTSRD